MAGSRGGRRPISEKEIPIGTRFGHGITTSAPYLVQQSDGRRQSHVKLRCEFRGCGNPYTAYVGNLKKGNHVSCGCYRNIRIGEWQKVRTGAQHSGWRGDDSKQSKLAWLKAEKQHPCVDCGKTHHWKVMQFDHVPERGPKVFTVGTHAVNSRRSLMELKAERAKCDLICPTCHVYRTLERQGALDDDDSQEVA